MALRRRFSYQWRLFFPLVLLLWSLIAGLFYFQYRREKSARADVIREQLTFINDRVIAAYNSDIDILPFLEFVAEYINGSIYQNIRLSVYDTKSGNLIYHLGTPLPNAPIKAGENELNIDGDADEALRENPGALFYKVESTSSDGHARSIAALPYTVSITDALKSEADLWLVTISLAILATFVAFFSTRYISRNIRLLRDFTTNAAEDNEFISDVKFPDDELGEISRQIISIYNKRSQALKDLEYEHRVALKATKEKARIKREMSNNINHELKTPIGIIKGYIDTIVENPDMDPGQRDSFLLKAQSNVDRLCAMLNDISTITRLEESGDNIPTEPLDFHELVFTVADEIRESGTLGDFKFEYEVPFDCVVRGNYNLLRGLILNLAKNALIHSKGSVMCLKMVNENDQFYTFAFYDNGVGVGEKHLPYLFDRFYRVDSGRSRKVGGTGLGLPIIKNTIVSLGGTISVKNRAEGGLEFNFTLPKDSL